MNEITVNSPQKVLSLASYMLIVGTLFYFWGSNLRMGVKRMVDSQRVAFEMPKDKIRAVKLKNGMRVVILQNDLKPKVLMRLCYDVGSACEASYERGLAHLVEHMIFKGTEKLAETDIHAITKKYGATANAATSSDDTSYYFEVDRANWQPFLSILADCMQNARFDEQALASELKAVVAELNGGRDNHQRVMFYKTRELLFPPNHPYHFPVIGFKEELSNITANELHDFYHRYYHPGNAVLFIIGDVALDEALQAAKNAFEELAAQDEEKIAKSPTVVPVLQTLDEINYKIFEDVQNEELWYFWPLAAGKDLNYATLTLADAILGGERSSILYRRLVDEEKVAEHIVSTISPGKQASMAYIIIRPKPGLAARCEEVLRSELSLLLANGVTLAEVGRRIPRFAKSFLNSFQDFNSLSYAWMRYYFQKSNINGFFQYIDELYEVTAEKVNEFFREFFTADSLKKIHLLPLQSDKRELWAKNRKMILEQEQRILQNHLRTKPVEEPSFVQNMPPVKPLTFEIPRPSLLTELNGIKVVLHHDDRLPIANFALRFKNAEYYDYAQNEDFDLMMHLLIEGSIGFSKQNHLDFFEAMGADVNFTGKGVTCSVLESNLLPVLERIFYILKKPTFRRDAFEKEREIIIGQIMQLQSMPDLLANRQFWQTVFQGTELDYSYQDFLDRLKKLSLRDVVATHDHINGAEVVLGISGKFREEEVITTLTKLTRSSKPLAAFVPKSLPEPSNQLLKDAELNLLRGQTLLFLGMPQKLAITDADYPLLRLASYVTFVGMNSRYFKIREATGLFYFCHGGFAADAGTTLSHSYVSALLSPDNLVQGEQALRDMFAKLVADGVNEEELAGAKRDYFNRLLDCYSNNLLTLETFLHYLARGLPLDLPQTIWTNVQNATVEQVNQALAKHFNPQKLCRIRVGDMGNAS